MDRLALQLEYFKLALENMRMINTSDSTHYPKLTNDQTQYNIRCKMAAKVMYMMTNNFAESTSTMLSKSEINRLCGLDERFLKLCEAYESNNDVVKSAIDAVLVAAELSKNS